MTYLTERCSRLYRTPADLPEAAEQIQDLRHTVYSLIQEVEAVLRAVISHMPGFDMARYRSARVERMLADHSSVGAYSWRNSSSYKYTLNEEEFLRDEFQMSDDEIASYNEQAAYLGTLT